VQVFKTKTFAKWAGNEGLDDGSLLDALDEMDDGKIDTNLGGNVYKKR